MKFATIAALMAVANADMLFGANDGHEPEFLNNTEVQQVGKFSSDEYIL